MKTGRALPEFRATLRNCSWHLHSSKVLAGFCRIFVSRGQIGILLTPLNQESNEEKRDRYQYNGSTGGYIQLIGQH